ncbi:hypothetical protein [Streptomyces ortus]|uniref:Restriction endonuclease subunit S n=1 Tax=Streptomyces ortus TaxID=2867268 RepID=A0ABT3V951_9ACTN|nr:hypothetical protein [Streptomyces ortus]MCX4236474.1 hypothetical protein [Streptomyces ortus]
MSADVSGTRFLPLEALAEITGGVALGGGAPGGAVELPYLRVANVQDGYIDTHDVKTVGVPASAVRRFRLMRGDVLLTEGGDLDKLGRGAVWDGRIDPCLHQNHIFKVRCDRAKLLPEFLSLYMASGEGKSFFLRVAKQTTNLASISSSQLKAMPVPVHSLAGQRRIVDVIETVSAQERAIEASIAKLEAFSGGVMAELADLECGTLNDVLDFGPQNGIYKPGSSYGLEGTPIVRIDSFRGGPSDFTRNLLRVAVANEEVERYKLVTGDVLINRVNTPELVGKSTAVGEVLESTVFESNMMRCKLRADRAVPAFVETWLGGRTAKAHFRARAKSAISQASINGSDVRSCPFPKLHIAEQLEFLDRLAAVRGQQRFENGELVKLRKLKQGIMDGLLDRRVSV